MHVLPSRETFDATGGTSMAKNESVSVFMPGTLRQSLRISASVIVFVLKTLVLIMLYVNEALSFFLRINQWAGGKLKECGLNNLKPTFPNTW